MSKIAPTPTLIQSFNEIWRTWLNTLRIKVIGNSSDISTLQSDVSSLQSASTPTYSHITGLALSNGTDTDHDIDVATGNAYDSTLTDLLELGSILTKQIDASWATGDDAGGLSSSLTVANSTWYHVFLVTIAGTVDVIFDTSLTCANGVTDHSVTSYRRIGSVLTDGSANIYAFVQEGNTFVWVDVKTITTTVVTSSTYQANTYKPLGVNCIVNLVMFATCGATGGGTLSYHSDLENTLYTVAPTRDNYDYGCSVFHSLQQDGFYYMFSSSSTVTGSVQTPGYIDFRGQN